VTAAGLCLTTISSRVVVACVDHDDIGRHAGKKVARQFCHSVLGNSNDDHLATTRSLDCRHGGCPDLRRKVAQRLWSTRVCDRNLVTDLRESSLERSADHAGADDSDPHV
jgi:hypothetical protein